MQMTAKRLVELGITEEYFDKGLSDYIGKTKVKKIIESYCRNFKNNKYGTGIYFFGPRNSGKTLLGTLILKHVLSIGFSARRVSFENLVSAFFKSFDEPEIFEPYRNVDLLFVDDVGREKANEMTGNCLASLFSYRVERRKPVLIGAVIPPDELNNVYVKQDMLGLIEAKMSVVGLDTPDMSGVFQKQRKAGIRI